jgi:hypothetical protein
MSLLQPHRSRLAEATSFCYLDEIILNCEENNGCTARTRDVAMLTAEFGDNDSEGRGVPCYNLTSVIQNVIVFVWHFALFEE